MVFAADGASTHIVRTVGIDVFAKLVVDTDSIKGLSGRMLSFYLPSNVADLFSTNAAIPAD